MRKCVFTHFKRYERPYVELLNMYAEIPDGISYKADGATGFAGFEKANKYYDKIGDDYGFFHQFGMEESGDEEHPTMWSVAIVERAIDGAVFKVDPSRIKFIPDDFTHSDYTAHRKEFGW